MTNTIDVTCGIYQTEYQLTRHRDGSATVRAPYIKWTDNSGSLAFEKIRIDAKDLPKVAGFFASRKLENASGDMLQNYLN